MALIFRELEIRLGEENCEVSIKLYVVFSNGKMLELSAKASGDYAILEEAIDNRDFIIKFREIKGIVSFTKNLKLIKDVEDSKAIREAYNILNNLIEEASKRIKEDLFS